MVATSEGPGRALLPLLAWILGGAAVFGGAAYLVGGSVRLPISQLGLTGMGIALGGGFGGVLKLLAFSDAGPDRRESMTVDMGETGASTDVPEPRPADLFEASPAPLVYYDDAGEGPVVRAVNPAFEETFGVGARSVESAALGDALMVTDRAGDVVAAAAEGAPFRADLDCETTAGTAAFRIQVAAVTDAAGARGYVMYTSLADLEGG